MKHQGPGLKCSPRSGAALSPATGLYGQAVSAGTAATVATALLLGLVLATVLLMLLAAWLLSGQQRCCRRRRP